MAEEAKIVVVEQDDDVAAWEEAARAALNRIRGKGSQQKKAAIVKVVSAKLAGNSIASVFKDKETRPCNPDVFWRWMAHDKLFKRTIEEVEQLARTFQDEQIIRDLKLARQRLAMAAPVAATELVRLMRMSPDEKVRLQAANSILDRADLTTATKQDGVVRHGIVNSDVMADLIREAMARKGSLIDE